MALDGASRENKLDDRLREILAIHFDPKWGAPYWLAKAKRLGFDPRGEIRTARDLPRLGLMDAATLLAHRLEDFIPKSLLDEKPGLIVAQTGGTLGRPAWTAYDSAEFHEAFVEPFVVAARQVGFPAGGTWLYVGPSGPHVIGRASDAIARHTGSMSPFAVDFDARWAQKLATGSFAATRYLYHIIDQAMTVVQTQPITTIFSTPAVIRALAESMSPEQRERIGGVHYGGTAIASSEMKWLQTEVFRNAVHLSGYGNTLFGCCLELAVPPGRALRYYPFGHRLLFGVLPEHQSAGADAPRYGAAGSHGRLVFTRLDRTIFLANVPERDHVGLVEPPPDAPEGFGMAGVESPAPMTGRETGPSISLY